MTPNTLYYGDNLDILRNTAYFPDACVDLIYLDPPFNSNRTYNVLFKEEGGRESQAQIQAFDDTWHWGESAELALHELLTGGNEAVASAAAAFRTLIGRNQMLAYLVMMGVRLVELHRVLKPTGSLYLHCDPTASHYLKILLDAIFGQAQFRSEIIWKRTSAHNDAKQGAKQPGRIHDVILFYTKSNVWTWNPTYTDYEEAYQDSAYRHIEPDTQRRFKTTDLSAAKPGGDTSYEWRGKKPPVGRYWAYSKDNMERFEAEGRIYYSRHGRPYLKQYLDEMPGIHIQSVWADIPPLSGSSRERLGYPTQKPVALLERIIKASSNPGDVVLDPFCGCGTAIAAAQNLGRAWFGIDITVLSINLQKYRLRDAFGLKPGSDYKVIGEPVTVDEARALARDSENDGRYQFQFWALSLVQAMPRAAKGTGAKPKRGKDQGVDGILYFLDGNGGGTKPHLVIVQVKSGARIKSGDIRDLVGTMEREGATLGVFITLETPTRDMEQEALSAGFYESPIWQKRYARVQLLTIEALLNGAVIAMPSKLGTFKQAPGMMSNMPKQNKLGM